MISVRQETAMTIDLDVPAPRPARTYGTAWAAFACVVSILLGAAAMRVVDTPPPTAALAAPQLHLVTIAATGGQPYIALTGAVENVGGLRAGTAMLPVGTTVHVFVVGTVKGVEVTCSVSVDGGEPMAANAFGIGAVAYCPMRIRETG